MAADEERRHLFSGDRLIGAVGGVGTAERDADGLDRLDVFGEGVGGDVVEDS